MFMFATKRGELFCGLHSYLENVKYVREGISQLELGVCGYKWWMLLRTGPLQTPSSYEIMFVVCVLKEQLTQYWIFSHHVLILVLIQTCITFLYEHNSEFWTNVLAPRFDIMKVNEAWGCQALKGQHNQYKLRKNVPHNSYNIFEVHCRHFILFDKQTKTELLKKRKQPQFSWFFEKNWSKKVIHNELTSLDRFVCWTH